VCKLITRGEEGGPDAKVDGRVDAAPNMRARPRRKCSPSRRIVDHARSSSCPLRFLQLIPRRTVRDSIYIIPKSFSLFFMPFGRDRYRRVGPSRSRMRKLINGDSITVSNSAFNSLTGYFFIFVAIIFTLPRLYVVT